MKLKKCTPALFVKDAQTSRKFYTEILGFSLELDNEGTNLFFKEGFAIWQISTDNVIPKTLGNDNITNPANANRFELYFETDDLDNIYQTLKANDVIFFHEINTEIWGQRNFRIYDPDKHLIEIGEEMSIFLKRIYEEEGKNMEATAKRTFMPLDALRKIVEG